MTEGIDREFLDLLSALCESRATEQNILRLESLLRSNQEYVERYVSYLDMHGMLHLLEMEAPALVIPSDLVAENSLADSEVDSSVGDERSQTLSNEDAEIVRVIAEELARTEGLSVERFLASLRLREPRRLSESSVRLWNSVYTKVASVAAVLAIALFFWTFQGLRHPISSAPVVVASIDDSVGAKWSDPSLSVAPGTQLFTKRNLVLTDGVVEIAFNGGATVVVEAPATFELLSADSARLVWGRLVGLVPRSDIQLTIKTPNASITDLGTEFGVSVDQQQVTHLHVFKGRVSASTLDANGKTAQQQTVLVNKAVSLQPKTGAIEPAPVDTADRFVRRVLFPLPLYSTGVGLAEGDDDPHWEIVAAKNVQNFSPQQAVIATPAHSYGPHDSVQSQWVSLTKELSGVGENTSFTFRTTFDLSGFDPATASIVGSFSVDNQVTAIRVNGIEVLVPEHPADGFQKMFSFSVDPEHLEAGRNRLELDIFNGSEDKVEITSPIAVRVLLKGMGQRSK